jgi:hypothetical protein
LLLVCVFFGLTLIGSYWMVSSIDRPRVSPAMNLDYVAQISAVKDCKWSSSSVPPTDSEQLQIGRHLELDDGIVQITYSNHATVVLKGPASYTVDTPNSGYLSRGKLTARADTQESRQFTILTPNARFIDLGTEFGVKTDPKGRAEIAVFKGKVQAEAKLNGGRWTAPLSLSAGEAAICNNEKFTTQIVTRDKFPDIQPPLPPPFQRWQYSNQKLQQREDLAAYYDFQRDPDNQNVLHNRAVTGTSLNGKIRKADWVEGRFPGKNALEFKNSNTGIRINLPKEFSSVTLAVWVNIDKLMKNKEDNHNSLIMSDYWQKPLNTHWFLRTDGCVRLAMQNEAGDLPDLGIGDGIGILDTQKTPEWTSVLDHLGQWCMLATVYDPNAKTITNYFNGQPIETLTLSQLPRVKFGKTLIGAWRQSENDGKEYCVLQGRIDELMIFENALQSEEIKRLYEAGKP